MKTVQKLAIASTAAFTALAFAPMATAMAQTGPMVPSGHYCLPHDRGGTNCSFTSYEQCLATATGLDAECYGNTSYGDRRDLTNSIR